MLRSDISQTILCPGFEVEIYRNLTSQGMNSVKRKLTEDKLHRDSNCFLFLIISHGTADNFLLDRSAFSLSHLSESEQSFYQRWKQNLEY